MDVKKKNKILVSELTSYGSECGLVADVNVLMNVTAWKLENY